MTYLMPDRDGLLALDELEAAIRDDTQLVSVMHVNNETGVIQDIRRIGECCRQRDILLHVDAAQSVGKLPTDLAVLPVDLLSLTAHKFYGPQGIGALYMADRPGCHVLPLFHGGGQERGLRPGTPAGTPDRRTGCGGLRSPNRGRSRTSFICGDSRPGCGQGLEISPEYC